MKGSIQEGAPVDYQWELPLKISPKPVLSDSGESFGKFMKVRNQSNLVFFCGR
jgi:hypothetical protein